MKKAWVMVDALRLFRDKGRVTAECRMVFGKRLGGGGSYSVRIRLPLRELKITSSGAFCPCTSDLLAYSYDRPYDRALDREEELVDVTINAQHRFVGQDTKVFWTKRMSCEVIVLRKSVTEVLSE